MSDNKPLSFDIGKIQLYQKNKYPLLFIDQITETIPGKYAKAIKNFSFNEWFFPVRSDYSYSVPAFVLTESLEQTFLMTFLTLKEYASVTTSTICMDNVVLKRSIFPGSTLEITATLDLFRRGIAKGHSVGYVDGNLAVSLDVTVAINSVLNKFKPKL